MIAINLLITVLILGVVFYLLYWLIGEIPLPAPFAVVAKAIIAIVVVVVLLGLLFGGIKIPQIMVV